MKDRSVCRSELETADASLVEDQVSCKMDVPDETYRKRQRQAAIRLCRDLDAEADLVTSRKNWVSKTWPYPVRAGTREEQDVFGDR